VGKTTLTRFVSWLNNLSSYQIKAGRNYSVADFDEDLRTVMRRSGCRGEKICFIFDESNILSSAFLERMNALLAGGEVPGLFDGDDYTALINECKAAGMNKDGLDDNEAIYKAFTKNVQRYLHVVFTMNPANPDFSNRSASSPALFNRCVIDWFGDWTEDSMRQVAMDLTMYVDIPNNSFGVNMQAMEGMDEDGPSADPKNVALSNCLVDMHCTVRDLNERLAKAAKKFNYITPRDFIDLVKHFENLHVQKKRELNELQDHLGAGLSKLASTEAAVREL
jgi:dynein heavy chain 1